MRFKQAQQKASRDKKCRTRQFAVDDPVFLRNHAQGDKWLPETATTRTGPLSFQVTTPDERIVCCHQDQLRARMEV